MITLDTLRNTRATIFMRFHSYGEYLYLGVDAYILGGVNWGAMIKQVFTSIALLLVLFIMPEFVSNLGVYGDVIGLLWLFFAIFLIAFWGELMRRVSQNPGNFNFALRQAFRGSLNIGSFNLDDVMAFMKSTLHTGITAVRGVLKEEDIPIDSLDAFIKNINVNNNFEGSVSNVIGNVQGNVSANLSAKQNR